MAGVKSLKLSSPRIIYFFQIFVLTKHDDDDIKFEDAENTVWGTESGNYSRYFIAGL